MSNHSIWRSSVGYEQFALDSYVYLSSNVHQLSTEYRFPQQFFEDVIAVFRNNKDPFTFIYIVLFAVVLTMLRYAFIHFLVIPIAKKYNLPQSEREKLPECTWNFVYYSSSWLLTAYILIVIEKGAPLLHPETMWIGWQFNNELPFVYHVLYVVQLGFYLHSCYAIIAMDQWRKDLIVMVLHHIIAIILIFCGFSNRAHQAGTFVLFLHDICDVLLEGTKSAYYFKTQGKKKHPIFETIGNVGFILFCLVWIYSRLYTFPLKLIWSCTSLQSKMNIRIPLWFMTNVLLYLLLIMNLYWFTFILKVIYKIATGTDELKDSREYEEETDDVSNDSKETIKFLPIDTSTGSINTNDPIEPESGSHNSHTNNLRKRT